MTDHENVVAPSYRLPAGDNEIKWHQYYLQSVAP